MICQLNFHSSFSSFIDKLFSRYKFYGVETWSKHKNEFHSKNEARDVERNIDVRNKESVQIIDKGNSGIPLFAIFTK